MANIKDKNKKVLYGFSMVFITIFIIGFSFSYYTNTVKFFEDSRKPDGYSGYSLEREANDFIVDGCGTDTMLDTVTGLCWDKHMSRTGSTIAWSTNTAYPEPTWTGTSYNWPIGRVDTDYPAFNFCDDLTVGGNTDWRVPTLDELLSLSNEIDPKFSTCITLESFGFTNCQDIDYWASDLYVFDTTKAWAIGMDRVNDDFHVKTNSLYYLICVRRD